MVRCVTIRYGMDGALSQRLVLSTPAQLTAGRYNTAVPGIIEY